MCVCSHHQDVTLLIYGPRLNIHYKDLLDIMVYNHENYNCVMNICDQCPGKEAFLEMIHSSKECDLFSDRIIYKQYAMPDRVDIMALLHLKVELFDSLAEKFESLEINHFAIKNRTVLKNKTSSLKEDDV